MDIQKHPYFGIFPSDIQLKHIFEAGSASIFKWQKSGIHIFW